MIWENIRDLRKSAGLTQANLAEKLGMNRATISKYETGDICPPLPIIYKLCDILGCNFHDIVQSEPPHQSTEESRRQAEELMGKEPGYLNSDIPTEQSEKEKRVQRVRAAFASMSQEGQEEATRRVEELARLPEYQKKESPSMSSLWGFDRRAEGAVDPQKND